MGFNSAFKGLIQNLDPQFETRFTSPFWRLEFGGGSKIFGKFVDPCT